MTPTGRESGPQTVTQVLFDMDGLLLDTERIYTEVTQHIVGRFGKVFDWSVKGNMIGRGAHEAAAYLVETLELPISADDYLAERESLMREAFPAARALPGAERLVRHLARHAVPIAVATSSHQDLYELKTRHHGHWFDLFDAVVTGDHPDVRRAKPAPDIFLAAAACLGGSAAATLVFEDAPSGLEAGISAGMRVIAVPDPNMDPARYLGAVEVLGSLESFDPRRYGLPAYDD
jgi:pseudouridine-5'-monophosphatase